MFANAAVEGFAELVRAFCKWAESDGLQPDLEAEAALQHLIRLFDAALELPTLFDDKEAREIESSEWHKVFRRFGSLPFNYYSTMFDPFTVPSDEPVVADLADDLADIWRDLKPGLELFDAGYGAAAVWKWRNNFDIHWGRHAASATHALQCWRLGMRGKTGAQATPPSAAA